MGGAIHKEHVPQIIYIWPMNRSILAAAAGLLFSAGCAQRVVVQKLTYLAPYCGGARPTQQILDEAAKPKLYANRTIVLLNGSKADSVKTDNSGQFRKKLKPGNYRLVESWRYYHSTPDGAPLENYDSDCLKAEWIKEFAELRVTSKSHKLEKKFDIVDNCDRKKPCILESAVQERQ